MLDYINPFTVDFLLGTFLLFLMFGLVYCSGLYFAYFLNEVFFGWDKPEKKTKR
jgi:hypothetical protein